jgi:hypothetical protein
MVTYEPSSMKFYIPECESAGWPWLNNIAHLKTGFSWKYRFFMRQEATYIATG